MDDSNITININEATISKLNLEENDTLLVKIPGRIFKKIQERLSENLRKAFPGKKILIIPDDLDFSIIKSD